MTRWGLAFCALMLAGCAGTPVPSWELDARGGLERSQAAWLEGRDRVAAAEWQRARSAVARTGRGELMARAELARCAAQVAALQFQPCDGYAPLQADAAPAERAYAAYLQGAADVDVAALPAPQQPLAPPTRGPAADLALLRDTADPLSRLVGAALWLRHGRATAAVVALAVDTASAQGWRRPLLAWLDAQRQLALQQGDAALAVRAARRIDLVLQGPAAP